MIALPLTTAEASDLTTAIGWAIEDCEKAGTAARCSLCASLRSVLASIKAAEAAAR
jgi:hypothetical protein